VENIRRMMDDAKKLRAEVILRLEDIFTDDNDDLPLWIPPFPNKRLYGDEEDNNKEEEVTEVNCATHNDREGKGDNDNEESEDDQVNNNEEGDGDNMLDKVDLVSFPFP
jgi:hypothetical protein